MLTPRTTLGLLAAAYLAGTTLGTPTPQDPQRRAAPPKLVLEAGEHDLRALIDRVGVFLQRNYLVSETDFKNASETTITLQNPLALSRDNGEDMLTQLAFGRGFGMYPLSRKAKVYQWVALQGPHRSTIAAHATELTPAEVLAKRNSKVYVMTAVPIEHVPTLEAASALRPFLMSSNNPGQLTVGATMSSGTVLIRGFADQVAELVDLLAALDRPSVNPASNWRKQLDALEQRLRAVEAAGAATRK